MSDFFISEPTSQIESEPVNMNDLFKPTTRIERLISVATTQILAETLNIDDLNNFRIANGLTILNSKIPVQDSSNQINSIYGLTDSSYRLIRRMNVFGTNSIQIIFNACEEGDFESVEILLKSGLDPNIMDEDKFTPIIVASESGHIEIVKLLIQYGADVDTLNHHRETALVSASKNGHPEIVEILFQNGAKINEEGTGYPRALYESIFGDHVEVFKFLLEHIDNPNLEEIYKKALPKAISGSRIGSLKILQFIIDSGFDLNQTLDNGLTALSCTVHPHTIEVLLRAGADINAKCEDGSTALFHGCNRADIKQLLEAGADPHVKDNNGATVLMYYVRIPLGVDRIELLLEHGADPNARDNEGNDILSYIHPYCNQRYRDNVTNVIRKYQNLN